MSTIVGRPDKDKIHKHNTECTKKLMSWEWVAPPYDDCRQCVRCGVCVNVEHPMDWQKDLQHWEGRTQWLQSIEFTTGL